MAQGGRQQWKNPETKDGQWASRCVKPRAWVRPTFGAWHSSVQKSHPRGRDPMPGSTLHPSARGLTRGMGWSGSSARRGPWSSFWSAGGRDPAGGRPAPQASSLLSGGSGLPCQHALNVQPHPHFPSATTQSGGAPACTLPRRHPTFLWRGFLQGSVCGLWGAPALPPPAQGPDTAFPVPTPWTLFFSWATHLQGLLATLP